MVRRRSKGKRGPFATQITKKLMGSKGPVLVDVQSKTIIQLDEVNVDAVFKKFFGRKINKRR